VDPADITSQPTTRRCFSLDACECSAGFIFPLSLSSHPLSPYVFRALNTYRPRRQSGSSISRQRLVQRRTPFPSSTHPVTLLPRINTTVHPPSSGPGHSLSFSLVSRRTLSRASHIAPSLHPNRHAIHRLSIRHPQESRATSGQTERTAQHQLYAPKAR